MIAPSDDVEARIGELLSLAQVGAHAEMERQASHLLERHPDQAVLWKILGIAQWSQGKSCLEALGRAVALAPEDAESRNNLAHALLQAGQIEPAEQQCRQALARQPHLAEAHLTLGNVLMSGNRPGEALAAYDCAIAERPAFAEAHSNRSRALRALARPAEAVEACRRAIELRPRLAVAHCNLASACLDLDRPMEACEAYRTALKLRPDLLEAHRGLGRALSLLSRPAEALQSIERALQLQPGDASLHLDAGNVHFQQRDYDAAAHCYAQAVGLDPRSSEAHYYLGHVLIELCRPREALAPLQSAIELAPQHIGARVTLAQALIGMQRYPEAAAVLREALELDPDCAPAKTGLGAVLRQLDRPEEAETLCREVLAADPQNAPALFLLGQLTADRGEFAAAEPLFHRALELRRDYSAPLAELCAIRRMTAEDRDWYERAQAQLASNPSPGSRMVLHFALGKYHDDLEQYDLAFEHYRHANELSARALPPYEAAAAERRVEERTSFFDTAWFERNDPGRDSSSLPVLVIGLPRSGTTLIEQILSSHPQVAGAGQVFFWATPGGLPLATWTGAEGRRSLAEAAAGYLRELGRFAGTDTLRVVEKTFGNYWNIGLIHAALPNARFIQVLRHPADMALSIYFHDFPSHEYATTLEGIAHHFRCYQRMMQHWRAHLPAGALLQVPYEGLVAEPEVWTRRMLEFVGLPWDERCLAFGKRSAPIHNYSRWQVRQPVNARSVERWRRYERHLGALRQLLDAEA